MVFKLFIALLGMFSSNEPLSENSVVYVRYGKDSCLSGVGDQAHSAHHPPPPSPTALLDTLLWHFQGPNKHNLNTIFLEDREMACISLGS